MGKLQKAMANLIKDSLQQLSDQPIVKGLFPTLLGTSLSMLEVLEIGLRVTGLTMAVIIGGLTIYCKWKDAVELYEKSKRK